MTPEEIYQEFQNRIALRREKMPSEDDCPWSHEEYECYIEGLRQGYMFASEILRRIITAQ